MKVSFCVLGLKDTALGDEPVPKAMTKANGKRDFPQDSACHPPTFD